MYGAGVAFQPTSSAGGSSKEKKRRDEDDEEEEDDNEGKGTDAWERAYADERSWEDLQEDESGLLRPIDTKTLVHAQYRKRLLLRSSTGGSVASRIQKGKLECCGEASLQNALELVHGYLSQIPSYGHREVLILSSALTTCDPGDVMETVQRCKRAKIRCSVIGLSAEVFICKHLCEETGGTYTVALNESHFKELLLEHAPPPPAIAEYAAANLIKMGFPQRGAEGVVSICSCHKEAKVGGGYTCPRCKVRVCELPTECRTCGLTLVSSPHLARSYHHLFPVAPFDEVSPHGRPGQRLPTTCFGCQQSFVGQGGAQPSLRTSCPKCNQFFCIDCDIYIHESLHNCPGCESQHNSSV
ncbi:General transcription factor IIH subunit 2 [Rhynchospora pubera]|uniref:General transcription factor IIH subunit 2 n=1 Tax=Rhynchospora pubera TaxID=906938 RepID=A0AAV8GB78_9POAL|nr:General transcription factor IIH subunit 2 [Rhynchospora pubera]